VPNTNYVLVVGFGPRPKVGYSSYTSTPLRTCFGHGRAEGKLSQFHLVFISEIRNLNTCKDNDIVYEKKVFVRIWLEM